MTLVIMNISRPEQLPVFPLKKSDCGRADAVAVLELDVDAVVEGDTVGVVDACGEVDGEAVVDAEVLALAEEVALIPPECVADAETDGDWVAVLEADGEPVPVELPVGVGMPVGVGLP